MKVLLHFIITILYAITGYHSLMTYVKYKSHPGQIARKLYSNGGPIKYLTSWTLFAHIITSTLTLITDVFDNSFIIETRNLVFNGVAIPSAIFVSTTFWFLFVIDRDMICPKAVEEFEPQWKNRVIHTLPLISVVLDIHLIDHKSGQNDKELFLLCTAILMYMVTFLYLGFYKNDWVYPFVSEMSLLAKIMFIFWCYTMGIVYYYLGRILCKITLL